MKEDGGSAFPVTRGSPLNDGMSLRDWFAGQALAGMNANPLWDDQTAGAIAAYAYATADAMIKERIKE